MYFFFFFLVAIFVNQLLDNTHDTVFSSSLPFYLHHCQLCLFSCTVKISMQGKRGSTALLWQCFQRLIAVRPYNPRFPGISSADVASIAHASFMQVWPKLFVYKCYLGREVGWEHLYRPPKRKFRVLRLKSAKVQTSWSITIAFKNAALCYLRGHEAWWRWTCNPISRSLGNFDSLMLFIWVQEIMYWNCNE